MTVDESSAARRIMEQFGETSQIPYLGIEEGDVGLLISIPILGLVTAGLTGLEALAFPLMAGGFGLGMAIVYVSPEHLTAWTWIQDVCRHLYRPRVTFNAPENPSRSTNETERNTGGLAGYTPLQLDERTQDLTNVRRAWPGAGAIQRTDGTMEAFIEVDAGNMDFAMSDDWTRLQDAAAEFANTELTSNLKFHATTRSFPVEQIVETIETRREDDDVAENLVVQELLDEYRETRPEEMQERGIQQLRYYIGVQVSPLEVYDRYHGEETPAEKLTEFPVIGFLFNPFVTRREDLSERERRMRMFDTLDSRMHTVEAELVQQAPGWSARRLSTTELFALNLDFWNGREHQPREAQHLIRDRQIIGQASRTETENQDV
jgi:hypothetical protein